MFISAVADTTIKTQEAIKSQTANGGADFAAIMEKEKTLNTEKRVFKGAPDFIFEWAEKYNVHISKTAVPLGQNGPYTPAVDGIAPLPTVHIHPKALERMINDPAFAEKIEKDIARMSNGMHRAMNDGVAEGLILDGTSITIHEDGSVTCEVFVSEEAKEENWELVEALMKKVDAICEAMHIANEEKVQQQLDAIRSNRAISEFRRINMNITQNVDMPADDMTAQAVTGLI